MLPVRRRRLVALVGAKGLFRAGDTVAEAFDLALEAVYVLPLRGDRLVEILDHSVLMGEAGFERVEARCVGHSGTLAQQARGRNCPDDAARTMCCAAIDGTTPSQTVAEETIGAGERQETQMSAMMQGWLLLGTALFALVLVQSAVFAQTSAAKALRDEASEATTAGRYVDALAAYAGAIAAAPDEVGGYVQRADLFVSLGHSELAALDYRAAARISPDDVRLQNGLCRNLAIANHDLVGALVACDAAVRLAPRDPVVLATRGYLQLRRGAWALAEKDYADALDLAPASPDEMYGHGLAKIHLGQARSGLDEMSSATLDSSGLPLEWESRGFSMTGDVVPGRPLTKAEQALVGVGDRMFFLNKGEGVVQLAGGCSRVVTGVEQRAAAAGQAWSGVCRFGLVHGEDKRSGVRFAYGREITGAAQEQKLDLAYRAAEEALRP